MATGATFADAIPLEYGARATGQVNASMLWVYFKFNVSVNDKIIFQAFSNGDTYGALYSETGSLLTSDDDGGEGLNPFITYTATYDGVLYGGIRAYWMGNTIDFEVSLEREVYIELGGGSFNDAINATIDADGEVRVARYQTMSYLRLECIVGDRYFFETTGEYGSYADLYNDQLGQEMHSSYHDDGINAYLDFIAVSSIMYIRISTLDTPRAIWTIPYHIKKFDNTKVWSISISPQFKNLQINTTFQMTVTIEPETALNKNVTWHVQYPGIVTIDEMGNVTGISLGETLIAAVTEDGEFFAEATILVTELGSITTNGKLYSKVIKNVLYVEREMNE